MIESVKKDLESLKLDNIPEYTVKYYKEAIDKKVNAEKVKYVVGIITPRREDFHPNKGITYRVGKNLTGIPFDKQTIIPAVEFNRLVMKQDAVRSVENPYSYKTTITFGINHDGEFCDAEGVVKSVITDKDADIIRLAKEGRFDEIAALVGKSLGHEEQEQKKEYEIREEDGIFKVFKVGGVKAIKKFDTIEDAETYKESLYL